MEGKSRFSIHSKYSIVKWLCLLTLSLIWGSSFILIKKGLTGFDYVNAATIRIVSAGIVFLPFGFYHIRKISYKKIPWVVMASLLSMVVPAYLFCFSQQHIQSSVAGMLNALTPMFTFVFSLLFFKKKHHLVQIIGLAVGLIACLLLITSSSRGGIAVNIFALLVVVSTLCYGLNINIVKYYLAEIPSFRLSAVTVSIAGLLAFVFVLVPNYREYVVPESNYLPLVSLLTLGLVGTAFAQFLQNKLIDIASPLFASATTYIIPVVAIFWGIRDGEEFTAMHGLGISGILTAVLMMRKERKQ